MAIVGVICLVVGFLSAIISVGLLRLMNWARVVAVGLSIFNLEFFLVFLAGRRMVPFSGTIPYAIVRGALNGWIITYLLKSQVKQTFGVAMAP